VPQRLGVLVEQLRAARDRRSGRGEWADRLADVLTALAADHLKTGVGHDVGGVLDGRLSDLRAVFRLTALDVDLLMAAAAPDLDANFGIAFALLQGDPARVRPGIGLALELSDVAALDGEARSRVGPAAPLRRHDLVQLLGEDPLLQRPLRVPDRVVAHLLGDDTLEPRLAAMVVEAVTTDLAQEASLARAVDGGIPLIWVRSDPGSAGLAAAAAAFSTLGIDHLAIDLRRRASGQPLDDVVRGSVREAGLRRCGLVLTGADVLAEPDAVWLLQLLEQAAVPVIAVAARTWDASWLRHLPFVVEAPSITGSLRGRLWQERLGADVARDGAGWRELVGLRLSPEEIDQTARYAEVLARARAEPLSVATAREAARRLSADMSGAKRGRATAGFDDLVLPPTVLGSLHELVDWARHRDDVLGQGPLAGRGGKGRGITALFSGSPGTGKTLAAHVIAGELGLDLHTVELSSIVDKYIGETEKNLERVFREAESLNVLLFFDEADALFGARSEVRDARDRYANQEVAYLLQRMEQFDGIAVLATNLRGNLDVAFSRRLHFVVHFPDPDVPTRRQLWETHVSAIAEVDAADPVDLDHLADKVEVAGGDVRNIVLAAAYAAATDGVPVGMRHVVNAVVREYRKLGRRLPVPGLMVPEPSSRPSAAEVEAGDSEHAVTSR
jgi:hypothetical protein